MNTKHTMLALGLSALLGGASLGGAAMASSHDGGGHGGTMEGMGDCPMMSDGTMGDCPMMNSEQAQEAEDGHGTHGSAAELPASPATEAYRAANLTMHEAVNLEFNADIDFARGMIGHHQGAIDMARIVLEHGENPKLRALA